MIDDSMGLRYVVVNGTVAIEDNVDDGLAFFKALRAKHGRTEQNDDELRLEMIRDQRVLLVVTPDDDQGDWHCKGF